MRNGAELGMAQFGGDIQVLTRDDAGNASTAQQVAQQAIDEGAEIILGPLFAPSVQAVGHVARARNIPVIAFSTDFSVAGRGVYLLSLLPESDVDRIVEYAISQGKRSFVALIPENAYGSVVEGEFRQIVAEKGGRIVALERYSAARAQDAARSVAQAAGNADALFIPGDLESVSAMVQALSTAGVNPQRLQLLGTGLWENPRTFANALLQDGWYVGPDPTAPNSFKSSFGTPLSHALWQRPRARGKPVLRCGYVGRRAGQDPRHSETLHARSPDQHVGLLRHRWGFPVPAGRIEPARARGAEGHQVGWPGRVAGPPRVLLGHLITQQAAQSHCRAPGTPPA